MTKIYLAKSNRANPDYVMAVRNLLSRFDVEVVEFKGGSYSHKPMLDCDLLVVVPELQENDEDLQYVNLGKGLFEQIETWQKHNKNKSDLLIVNQINDYDEIGIGKFDEFDICDPDDYVNYSAILFDYDSIDGSYDDSDTLQAVFENRLNQKTTSKKSSTKIINVSRYKLLLTKGN